MVRSGLGPDPINWQAYINKPTNGSNLGAGYRWYQIQTRLPKGVPYPLHLLVSPEGEFSYLDPLYPRIQTHFAGLETETQETET